MVGRRVVSKPSRSDEILDPDQQLQIADQVRAQFDALAPKRPAKPNRSEPDSTLPMPAGDIAIPELDKLQSLQSQAVFSETDKAEQEEFVETHYYDELVSIDKQHHTTGTGFIKVVREGDENGYGYQLNNGGNGFKAAVFKSNPATNDWIPSVEDQVQFSSSKPNRSEGD
nr:Maternal effect embryo arrest 59, putative isoform 1 [Ipomoea batatas]